MKFLAGIVTIHAPVEMIDAALQRANEPLREINKELGGCAEGDEYPEKGGFM